MCSNGTSSPQIEQVRWYLMRPWSLSWSWLKRSVFSSVAGYRPTGIETSPNEIAPFHMVLGIAHLSSGEGTPRGIWSLAGNDDSTAEDGGPPTGDVRYFPPAGRRHPRRTPKEGPRAPRVPVTSDRLSPPPPSSTPSGTTSRIGHTPHRSSGRDGSPRGHRRSAV